MTATRHERRESVKQDELAKVMYCGVCGKVVNHDGMPLFYRVRVQRYGLDVNALKRQQGLTMMMSGHHALARIMGPDEDMATRMSDHEVTVCESCSHDTTMMGVLAAAWKDEDENGGEEPIASQD